jgi:hypothetical protein
VAKTFVTNASVISSDIHGFRSASSQPVIQRARLTVTQGYVGDDVLEGTNGLLVNVVRIDEFGWCTCITSNGRVGLLHKQHLRQISSEEMNGSESGPSVDAMLDAVREKMPEMMLLFDAMMDEAKKLRETLET